MGWTGKCWTSTLPLIMLFITHLLCSCLVVQTACNDIQPFLPWKFHNTWGPMERIQEVRCLFAWLATDIGSFPNIPSGSPKSRGEWCPSIGQMWPRNNVFFFSQHCPKIKCLRHEQFKGRVYGASRIFSVKTRQCLIRFRQERQN